MAKANFDARRAALGVSDDFRRTFSNLGVAASASVLNSARCWVYVAENEVVCELSGRFTVIMNQARMFGFSGRCDISRELDLFELRAHPTGYFDPSAGPEQNRSLHDFLLPHVNEIMHLAASRLVSDPTFVSWASARSDVFYTSRQLQQAFALNYRQHMKELRSRNAL